MNNVTQVNQTYHIRAAVIKDDELIHSLMKQQLSRFFDKTNEKWSDNLFWSRFRRDRISVIETQEQIFTGFYDTECTTRGLYIHNLQITPSRQRMGIGSFVIQTLTTYCKNSKLQRLYGKVFAENTQSLQFCLKNGFYIESTIPCELSYWLVKSV